MDIVLLIVFTAISFYVLYGVIRRQHGTESLRPSRPKEIERLLKPMRLAVTD
jgi:hypothetical protein